MNDEGDLLLIGVATLVIAIVIGVCLSVSIVMWLVGRAVWKVDFRRM